MSDGSILVPRLRLVSLYQTRVVQQVAPSVCGSEYLTALKGILSCRPEHTTILQESPFFVLGKQFKVTRCKKPWGKMRTDNRQERKFYILNKLCEST